MTQAERKNNLLQSIEQIKRKRHREYLNEFRKELRKVSRQKADAKARMQQQEAAGDLRGASLSRKAYEYCSRRESQLRNIIKGYEMQEKGTHYFTKGPASQRFLPKQPT